VPLATRGDDGGPPIELDVRIARGTETAAIRALEALGARAVEQRAGGELRVAPGGPLRPFLDVEQVLAIFAVRPLPRIDLAHLDDPAAVEAAQELAGLVLALWRGRKPTTVRLTAGPEVVGDRAALGRLGGQLARRLGLMPSAIAPDLVVIVRKRGEGLELCARLPLPRRDPPAARPTDPPFEPPAERTTEPPAEPPSLD
jgi:hypothetical protein